MKKIFVKEWLLLHPYAQSTSVDAYYTNISNRIYEIFEATGLINSFEEKEAKQTSLRLAAYFEDVISQTNIWRTFIRSYKEDYGRYLPFFETSDHYYEDEVNLEDVRFLLWHYIQQYHGWRKGTFVSPENPVTQATANMVYNLFCEEWTVAPENDNMRMLFSPETRYENDEAYDKLLHWFHYHSYLVTDAEEVLSESLKEVWEKEGIAPSGNEIFYFHHWAAMQVRSPFRAYTSPQWLLRLVPEGHPDYDLFKKKADESVSTLMADKEKHLEEFKKDYEKFLELNEGKLFRYYDNERNFYNFLTQDMGMEFADKAPADAKVAPFAATVSPEGGVEGISFYIRGIKDPDNPFYSEEFAKEHAIGVFAVKLCSAHTLIEMVKQGMLDDAHVPTLLGEEHGKELLRENWKFLVEYFYHEEVKE